MSELTIRKIVEFAKQAPFRFSAPMMVASVVVKHDKSGKEYLDVTFADSTDSVRVKAWSNSFLYGQLVNGGVSEGVAYTASGTASVNAYGVEIAFDAFEPLRTEELDRFYLGNEEQRSEARRHFDAVIARICKIEDPRLLGVCEALLASLEKDSLWYRVTASRKNHHAGFGGLMLHVREMLDLADAVCAAYPELNRDLLVAGVLFHDIGKTVENAFAERSFQMPFSVAAELSGHIPIGCRLLENYWRVAQLDCPPEDWEREPKPALVLEHLRHLILSHHGKEEWGSPVKPKTPEAQVLHLVDMLSARLRMFKEAYESSPQLDEEGNVFDRNWLLEVNPVKPLPVWKQVTTE